MSDPRRAVPPAVLTYGLLGLVPFLGPPLAGALLPVFKPVAAMILALYGGLILSFLGGARWGLAITHHQPAIGTISLAMIPTLAGLALLLLPSNSRGIQLTGIAASLALHCLWDIADRNLPAWYPRLRTILTAGAIAGLLAGAVVLT